MPEVSVPVHSRNSISTTIFGFTQRKVFISSAVMPSPHLPFFVASGKLAKGQLSISSPLIKAHTSAQVAGLNPGRTLLANMSFFPS